ncbi:MAG: NTP transferase domain-containing protein [Deltaproteobacteria bacterium]|nr:NTP transferase domain-containing protein [Deltaproteobacteria bacterium]
MKDARTTEHELAAIVLAGGDGARLRSLTAMISGTAAPKQFCRIMGKATLLEQTLQRVASSIQPSRTVTVLTGTHKRFYRPLVDGMRRERLAIQPSNRGTAPGILYGLMKIAAIAPSSTVAVFPSDHYVSNDTQLMRHVKCAARAVKKNPHAIVLLGVVPNGPEPGYGWIEPGEPAGNHSIPIYSVRRFWEKPDSERANQLYGSRCLWNMFVVVGQVENWMEIFKRNMASTYSAFEAVALSLNTKFEKFSITKLYQSLNYSDFSHEILAKSLLNLAVIPVKGVEWCDLGEPQRVLATFSKLGIAPLWAGSETEKKVSNG